MKLKLGDLNDVAQLRRRLVQAGLSPKASESKIRLFTVCAAAAGRWGCGEKSPAAAFFVPGRIEVLGKHTDYAGGRSITGALERGICAVAVDGDGETVGFTDAATNRCIRIDPDLQPADSTLPWSLYATTVLRRLEADFPRAVRGADIFFASDLPQAAGLSSSSSLVISFFLALAAVNNLSSEQGYRRNIADREDLAAYLSCVENGINFKRFEAAGGVGTLGGSEDHTAILCSMPNRLGLYSYLPTRLEASLLLPDDWKFVIACSGVKAEKTGAAMEKYNRASSMCRRAVELWNGSTGRNDSHLAAVLAAGPQAEVQIRAVLASASVEPFTAKQLAARYEHFLAESEQIVPAAGKAMANQDIAEFGRLAARSQNMAESLLGNQVPETSFLARSALEEGAAAASAFGAGFGGSVWAIVQSDDAQRFTVKWSECYSKVFPETARSASFFDCRPGPAVIEV